MIALIDAGNTDLKLAWLDPGAGNPRRARHRDGDVAAAAAVLCEGLAAPRRAFVASVLPNEPGAALIRALDAAWGCPIDAVRVRDGLFGVHLAYASPERLGVDRWLAMLGASERVPGDCVIADLGSALTVDVLRADGRHLGGLIVPGPEAMLTGLRAHTGVRADPAVSGAVPCLGDTTETALGEGFRLALTGTIDAAMRHARERLRLTPTLLLSGGRGAELLPALSDPAVAAPDLVLHGLRRFARHVLSGASA